jgi:hypothetical protein
VGKVFVASEVEGAQGKGVIARDGVGFRHDDLFGYGVHVVSLFIGVVKMAWRRRYVARLASGPQKGQCVARL